MNRKDINIFFKEQQCCMIKFLHKTGKMGLARLAAF
jgi:hypothetical protein